jgi:hypothetical protein
MAIPIKEILGTVFGGKSPIDSIQDVIKDFKTTPEDKIAMQAELDKVKQQWRDFESQMASQDVANTDSARAMNTAIQGTKPTWLARNVAYLLDLGCLSIWGSMTVYIVGRALKIIQTDAAADFNVVLGIYSGICGVFATVLNFHRGSSQGSADKQKMIDRMTQ